LGPDQTIASAIVGSYCIDKPCQRRCRHKHKLVRKQNIGTYQIAQRTDAKSAFSQKNLEFAEVWRWEVVLVGDAAENPARSTAGRPQLRGLTQTGEQRCTPRNAVRPRFLVAASRPLPGCQCAVGVAGTGSGMSIRRGKVKLRVRAGTSLQQRRLNDGRCDAAEMRPQRERAETGAWKMQALSWSWSCT
jgi:hypothetical protein